jgi:aminobenzoyl-glutamate utilization protein B
MYGNMQRLGPPQWDEADRALAKQFQATLNEEDIQSGFRRYGMKYRTGVELADQIVPLDSVGEPMMGSTDVGDVSWAVPLIQARGAVYAVGTPGHSWQLTAQGKTPLAHKGMVHVAKVMAGTAVDALKDPALIERAKADHAARTAVTPYVCPIPDDVTPPIQMSSK